MNKSVNRYIKAFPWYSGLTGDLLFYIAIDTLFLTLVKKLSPAEMVSITSLSQLACIVLQFPVLFIIKKIGNTIAVRLGAFCMLLSAVFITFGSNYYLILIGRIIHDIAVILRTASIVALENNLEMIGKRDDFLRIRTLGNTVYAVITMLISFVASFMFNYDHYLPMICCISTCTLGVVISLFMKDCSPYNRITYKSRKKADVKIHYDKIIIITILLYAIFYSTVINGHNEGKLFIQQNVLLDFNEDNTALIIGAIISVSRIIRVISNVVFVKLYIKYKSKIGVALPVLLSASMGFLLFGSFIGQFVLKIITMSVGYIIILFIRDPFKLYIQDVMFENTPKEQHQTLITVLEFGVKIATAGIGLVYSAVLISSPMIVVISMMFGMSLIGAVLSIMLYRALINGRKQLENS